MIVKPKAKPVSRDAKADKPRRTWRRRAHARPDEVLEAALDEFIAKGFDAARMEDIARRAGLSKAAIYLYFDSKEAVLRALIEKKVSTILAPVREMADTTPDPKGALRMMVKMIGATLADPRFASIPLLVVSIANRFPDLAIFYRENVIARGRATGEALIRRGIELGQFRDIDLKAATRALIGPVMFEVLYAHAFKGETELGKSSAWLDAQLDIFLDGISAREDETKAKRTRKAEKPR